MKFYLIMKNVKHMIVMAMLHSSNKVVVALVLVEDLRGLAAFRIFSRIFLEILAEVVKEELEEDKSKEGKILNTK